MKHLRIALESEDDVADREGLDTLAGAVDDLALIGEGLDDDDLPSDISMESIFNSVAKRVGNDKVAKFRASMEDLSGGVMTAIVAGIAALLALIYKGIKYFMGGGGGSSSGGGGGSSVGTGQINKAVVAQEKSETAIEDQVKVTEEVEKSIASTKPEVKAGSGSANHAQTKTTRTIAEVIASDHDLTSRMDHFYEKYSRYISLNANNSSVIKFFESHRLYGDFLGKRIGKAMDDLSKVNEKRAAAIKIVKASMVGALGVGAFSSQVQKLVDNVPDPDLESLGVKLDFGFGKITTFQELSEHTNQVMQDKPAPYKGSMAQAIKNLHDQMHRAKLEQLLTELPGMAAELEDGAAVLQNIETESNNLEAELIKQAGDSAEGKAAARIMAQKIRHMFGKVSLIMQSGMKTMNAVTHFVIEMEEARKEHLAIMGRVVLLVEHAELDSSDASVFHQLKNEIKSLGK